jgi:Ca-activated chloride channel family protein
MFEFGNPEYLHLAYLIPLLIALFLFLRYRRKKVLKKYGDRKVVQELMPEVSQSRPVIKFVVMLLALSFVIIALARPRFGAKLEKVKQEGREIIIALDVSNSMLAEDIKPNRLERAKRAIAQLTDRMKNDKVGMIVFAGDAYTQVPITSDYAAAKLFLSAVNTDMVSKQGTAIGKAIELAMNSFTPNEEASKALLIITDGENHIQDPVPVAENAAEQGIRVFTIGMGLPEGAPVPDKNSPAKYLQEGGSTVISKLDEQTLRGIAKAGEGTYIRANNIRTGVNAVFDEISELEKTEMEQKVFTEYNEKFQYFAGIALLLLLLDFFIMERKNRYLERLNIFGGNRPEGTQ